MAAKVADEILVNIQVNKSQADREVRNWQNQYTRSMNAVEGKTKQVEAQISRSSTAIGGHIRTLAGVLAAGFTTDAVIRLADGYTLLQNRLRIAGLEGRQMQEVQDQLYVSANKNGTAVGDLAQLYSRMALSQKDLGATTQQMLDVTGGVAAALRVQGISAEQAAGPLLQLGQAFGAGVVRAEEFNSLIEGMPVLVQVAAKHIDGASGSVSKLRNMLLDGKITSQEFFQALLKGLPELEEQAAKANLTIGQSFTVLNNELGRYVGQTDQSLSASQRMSQGILLLADNLDKIAPALAVIATLIGGRLLASTVQATVALIAKAGADALGAQNARAHTLAVTQQAAANARLVGLGGQASAALKFQAATSLTAAGASRALGGALLGLVGGPIGATILALAALVIAIKYANDNFSNMAKIKKELEAQEKKTTDAINEYEKAAIAAAEATGENSKKAQEAVNIKRELAIRELDAASAARETALAYALQTAELAKLAAMEATRQRPRDPGEVAGSLAYASGMEAEASRAQATAEEATATAERLRADFEALQERIRNGTLTGGGGSGGAGSGDGKTRRGRQRDLAAEAERAERERIQRERSFADQMSRYADQLLAATGDRVLNAQEQLALDIEELRRDRDANKLDAERQLADKDITEAQKAQLDAANEAVYQERLANTQRKGEQAIRDERMNAEQALLDMQLELLQIQSGSAKTAAESRRMQLEILRLQQERARAELEARLAADPTLDGASMRAALGRIERAQTSAVIQDTQDPLEQWLNESLLTAEQVKEAYQQVAADGLDRLSNSLVDVITGTKSAKEAFAEMALSILSDMSKIAAKNFVASIFGGGNGGGSAGGWASVLSSIFTGGKSIPAKAGGGLFSGEGSGTSDSNLVRISDGEYVVREKQTRKYKQLLDAINQDKLPKFARGGIVGAMSSASSLPMNDGRKLVQQFFVDAKGSILADQLMEEMQSMSAEQAANVGFATIGYQQSRSERNAARNRKRFI